MAVVNEVIDLRNLRRSKTPAIGIQYIRFLGSNMVEVTHSISGPGLIQI
jgi:hypothetical protein